MSRTQLVQSGHLVPACSALLLLLYPLAAGAGFFEPILNASSFARIYNASESNENWLGYSCASIGGEGTYAPLLKIVY